MKALLVLLLAAFLSPAIQSGPLTKERIMGGYRSMQDSSLLTLHIARGADSGNYTRIDVRTKSTDAGKWVVASGNPTVVKLISKSSQQMLAVSESNQGMILRSHPSGPHTYSKVSGPGAK